MPRFDLGLDDDTQTNGTLFLQHHNKKADGDKDTEDLAEGAVNIVTLKTSAEKEYQTKENMEQEKGNMQQPRHEEQQEEEHNDKDYDVNRFA